MEELKQQIVEAFSDAIDLDDTLEALSCYGELIVPEMVSAVYRNNIHKHLDD